MVYRIDNDFVEIGLNLSFNSGLIIFFVLLSVVCVFTVVGLMTILPNSPKHNQNYFDKVGLLLAASILSIFVICLSIEKFKKDNFCLMNKNDKFCELIENDCFSKMKTNSFIEGFDFGFGKFVELDFG